MAITGATAGTLVEQVSTAGVGQVVEEDKLLVQRLRMCGFLLAVFGRHVEQVRVHNPVSVTVQVSPAVVTTVGTVAHEVVRTRTAQVVLTGSQVIVVMQGVVIVKV